MLEAIKKNLSRCSIGCDINDMPLFISKLLLSVPGISDIEKELEKNISNCSDDRFEYFFDKSRGAWLSEMEERFGDRDKFMAKVRANSALPKVVKLNEAHLVPVPAGELELQLHLRLREKWEIARFRFRNWRYRKMKI